ncbi:BTB/POZ domain-containing protein kctd9 [Desmophyllum pertusum]|uniref:BTB/POZ domain-containing protein kctd9 n=1 Tax=Desmophyllum pertusum TaxID=174260 RepID=A0A9X0D4M8_9CNID|nr:BTB/POZ domain-containing protein kctd9 [Desmophyllum pertusum]
MWEENYLQQQDSWSNITDTTGAYLIDRSPVYFEPILNYLRHGQLILDQGVNPQGVLEEAKFFGISGILEQLEEMIVDKSEDAPLSRNEFVRILLSTPSNCELRCQVIQETKPIYFHLKYAVRKGVNN